MTPTGQNSRVLVGMYSPGSQQLDAMKVPPWTARGHAEENAQRRTRWRGRSLRRQLQSLHPQTHNSSGK